MKVPLVLTINATLFQDCSTPSEQIMSSFYFEILTPAFCVHQGEEERMERMCLFLISGVLPVIGPQPALFTWPTPNLALNGKLSRQRAILAEPTGRKDNSHMGEIW